MDALRLVRSTRYALAQARSVPQVLVEAWQTCTLTEAVGGHLALHGEASLRASGQVLADAGSHAGGCLDRPPDDWTGYGRAAGLTELAQVGLVLRELRGLLGEASEALVVVACSADTETLYWQCIDAVDAAAGCTEAITELLRDLREEPDPELAEQPEQPEQAEQRLGRSEQPKKRESPEREEPGVGEGSPQVALLQPPCCAPGNLLVTGRGRPEAWTGALQSRGGLSCGRAAPR